MIITFQVPIPDGMDREQAMEQLLGKRVTLASAGEAEIVSVIPTIDNASISCVVRLPDDGPLAYALRIGALDGLTLGRTP